VNSIFNPGARKLTLPYNGRWKCTIPHWIEMTPTIQGSKNCDIMKKARARLDRGLTRPFSAG